VAYRHPRIPLSRERKVRAFWARSFKPNGIIDRLLAETHPNPERSGCPSLWLLFGAATWRLPDNHPILSHLTDCSPCYREYRGIQQTESFVGRWQFRLSRAARRACVLLLRRLRRRLNARAVLAQDDGGLERLVAHTPAGMASRFVVRRRLTSEEWVDRTFERAMRKIRRGIEDKLRDLPVGSQARVYLEKLQMLPDEALMIEISSHAYPNPDRNGCPPYRALFELASRGPSADPAWKHIEHCSPCSVEIRTMKLAQQPRPS
jgi:hypothetical protein